MFNSASSITSAVTSILQQTYNHFEIVVWDDGSLDTSYAKVQTIQDERLRLCRNNKNLGAPVVRNQLLNAARGDLVAWLDSDDRSHPNRLAAQVAQFEANPALVLLGSWVKLHRSDGFPRTSGSPDRKKILKDQKILRFAQKDSSIRVRHPIVNQFSTSAVMHRMSVVRNHHLKFDETLWPAEDYAFWSALLSFGECRNLSYPFSYEGLGGMSHSSHSKQLQRQAVSEIHQGLWRDLGLPKRHGITLGQLVVEHPVEHGQKFFVWSFLESAFSYITCFPGTMRFRACLFALSLFVRFVLRRLVT